MATRRKAASTTVVFADLLVVAGDDPRHAVVAEQQLGALAALVLAGAAVDPGPSADSVRRERG